MTTNTAISPSTLCPLPFGRGRNHFVSRCFTLCPLQKKTINKASGGERSGQRSEGSTAASTFVLPEDDRACKLWNEQQGNPRTCTPFTSHIGGCFLGQESVPAKTRHQRAFLPVDDDEAACTATPLYSAAPSAMLAPCHAIKGVQAQTDTTVGCCVVGGEREREGAREREKQVSSMKLFGIEIQKFGLFSSIHHAGDGRHHDPRLRRERDCVLGLKSVT